jgi:hypothetical protein
VDTPWGYSSLRHNRLGFDFHEVLFAHEGRSDESIGRLDVGKSSSVDSGNVFPVELRVRYVDAGAYDIG